MKEEQSTSRREQSQKLYDKRNGSNRDNAINYMSEDNHLGEDPVI